MHDIALLNGIVIEPSDLKPQSPYTQSSEKKVHGGNDLATVLRQATDSWHGVGKSLGKKNNNNSFQLMPLKASAPPMPKQRKAAPSIDDLIPSEPVTLEGLEFSSDYEIPSEPQVPQVIDIPPSSSHYEIPSETPPMNIARSSSKKSVTLPPDRWDSLRDLGEEVGSQKLVEGDDDVPVIEAAEKKQHGANMTRKRSDTTLLPMREYNVLGALDFHKEEGDDELQLPEIGDKNAPPAHVYWNAAADRVRQAVKGDNAWRKDIQHRFLSALGDNKLVGKRLAPHSYATSTFETAVTWQMQAHKARLEGLGWAMGATLGQLGNWLNTRITADKPPEGEEREALVNLSNALHMASLKVGQEGTLWNQLKENGFPMYRQLAQWMPQGWHAQMGMGDCMARGIAEKRQTVTPFSVKDIFSPGELTLRVYSNPSLQALARLTDSLYAVDTHFSGKSLALDTREELVHYGNRVDSVLKWPAHVHEREMRQMKIPPGERSGAHALKNMGYEPKFYRMPNSTHGEYRYYKAPNKGHQK